jgi:hypothetical protein
MDPDPGAQKHVDPVLLLSVKALNSQQLLFQDSLNDTGTTS